MTIGLVVLLCVCCCVCSVLFSYALSGMGVYFKTKPPVLLNLSEDFHYQVQPKEISKSQYLEYMAQYEVRKIQSSEIRFKELPENRKAVVWIHGFNDYYHHFHVGEFLLHEGYNVYTITLPRYPQDGVDRRYLFYIDDITKYFSYIDEYIEFINQRNIHHIVLYGHSTGGLVSTAYLHEGKNRNKVSKLILNAPFFDFYDSDLKEFMLESIISSIAKVVPRFVVRQGKNELYSPDYYKGILSRYFFEQNKKLTYPSHVFAGWVRAVSIYHKKIQKNQIKVKVPVLVLTSSTSMKGCSGEQNGDCVLDVNETKKFAKNIGENVTIQEYSGAIHDVLLSKPDIVQLALSDIGEFLNVISIQ